MVRGAKFSNLSAGATFAKLEMQVEERSFLRINAYRSPPKCRFSGECLGKIPKPCPENRGGRMRGGLLYFREDGADFYLTFLRRFHIFQLL